MAYTPDNNPYIPGDPYSYDLKWQVDNIKHMQTRFAELDEQVQEATDQADRSEQEADRAVEEANRSRDEADRADSEALVSEGYAKGTQDGEAVTSGSPYFENNSKYYSEESAASAQASAGSASEAADYAAHIADPVSGLVTSWLNQHITQPTTPAIDTSLTVAGAAADAKAAGDYVRLLSDTIFDIYSFNPVFVNGEINGRTGVITPNPNRAIPQTPQFMFIAKDQTISITGKQMSVMQFTDPKFSNDTYIGMTGWVNTFTAPSNMYIVITAAELALANPIDPAEVPGALSFRSLDDAYDKIDQDINTLNSALTSKIETADTLLSDTIFDIYSFNPVFVNGEINGRTGVITPNPNRAIPQTPQFIFIAKDQTISITGKQMAVLQFTAPKFSNDTYIGMTGWVNTFTAPSNMYIVITAAELALANPIDPAEVPGALSFRSLNDLYEKFNNEDLKILWIGTSIPAGYPQRTNGYPNLIAEKLNCNIINMAIGGTKLSTGYPEYVTALNKYGIRSYADLSNLWQSTAEKNYCITNLQAIATEAGFAYHTPTPEEISSWMFSAYDNVIDTYINDINMIVINHGYNDHQAELWGDPSGYYDRFNFEGSMNCLIKHIKELNPNVDIVICGHYQKTQAIDIDTKLKKICDDWNVYYMPIYDKLGWSDNTITASKRIDSTGAWTDITPTTLTIKNQWIYDGVHPRGAANEKIRDIIAPMLANYKR